MKGLALLTTSLALVVVAVAAPPISPSPDRSGSMPSGPDPNVKLTEAYAKHVGRDAYFWAYPMLADYGRRIVASKTLKIVMAGPLPQAPLNRLAMSVRFVDPSQRTIASLDQNLASGLGVLALDLTPVVVQVPYFGDRYWFYQVMDARGDTFARLGLAHGTEAGHYLLVGPHWQGEPPKGIKKVFRSSTNSGLVLPRAYQGGTAEGNREIQGALELISMYPVADYDGTMKTVNWRALPDAPAGRDREDRPAIDAEAVFDVLADVLEDAPPLPGEEARYAQVLGVLQAAQLDPKLKAAMIDGAREAEAQLVRPLFAYDNFGREVQYHWRTVDNAGEFGTDYFTRTAVARSNAFIPPAVEVRTYASETDSRGNALQGDARYEFTVAGSAIPPASGWSLSLYDDAHMLVPNALDRYTLGSKNILAKTTEVGSKSALMKPAKAGSKTAVIKTAEDGSVTIYIQRDPPPVELRENWLPAPREKFSLVLRIYGQSAAVGETWAPPAVVRTQ